ncbi:MULTISPECIES: hypothetical protein [unclassified Bradyrhizobium]
MVPVEGPVGISGVEVGKAAASASAFPGADVHELPGIELPSAGAGAIVPVVLPVIEPRMATGMAVGNVGAELVLVVGALTPGIVGSVPPVGLIVTIVVSDTLGLAGVTVMTDGDSSAVAGEQFRLVPGMVGSSASGGDASVVAGAPGTVAAENRLVNGLGPVS